MGSTFSCSVIRLGPNTRFALTTKPSNGPHSSDMPLCNRPSAGAEMRIMKYEEM